MPLIVIVGINGRQGTSVANAFLNAPDFRIRGLTSSPDCPASTRWKGFGVEIREERFVDEEHVRASFEGATVIFVTTSHHQPFADHRAKLAQEVGLIKFSMTRFAMQREVYVGRMILDAAAATRGLYRLVLSTLPVILPGAKYGTDAARAHYYAKREHVTYLSRCMPHLKDKTILVKPCMHMEDYRVTLRMTEVGGLSFGTTAPPHVPLHWVNMKDDFGIFVRTLLLKLPSASFAFAAYSDIVSGEEICELISKISGITCECRQYTVEDMEKFENDFVSELLPEPAGSILYDPNVFTPASINEVYKKYNDPIRQTSFKDYLKAVLPEHIAALQKERASSPGVVPPPAKEEEGNTLALQPASRFEERGNKDTAVLRDVFMGATIECAYKEHVDSIFDFHD